MTVTIEISGETAERFRQLATALDDNWVSYMDDVSLFQSAHAQQFRSFRDSLRPNRTPSAHSISVTPEQRLVERMKPAARELFPPVRDLVAGLADDVQIDATTGYVSASVNGRHFVEINPRSNRLAVFMRPEAFDIPKGSSSQLHNVLVERPAKANWTLDTLVQVTPSTDLDGLGEVLRAAYTATRNLTR